MRVEPIELAGHEQLHAMATERAKGDPERYERVYEELDGKLNAIPSLLNWTISEFNEADLTVSQVRENFTREAVFWRQKVSDRGDDVRDLVLQRTEEMLTIIKTFEEDPATGVIRYG